MIYVSIIPDLVAKRISWILGKPQLGMGGDWDTVKYRALPSLYMKSWSTDNLMSSQDI